MPQERLDCPMDGRRGDWPKLWGWGTCGPGALGRWWREEAAGDISILMAVVRGRRQGICQKLPLLIEAWGDSKFLFSGASLVAKVVKNLPEKQETWVWSLDWDYPWRREWRPTPVLLPGESQGQGSLVGHNPWGHRELDTTEPLTPVLLNFILAKILQESVLCQVIRADKPERWGKGEWSMVRKQCS